MSGRPLAVVTNLDDDHPHLPGSRAVTAEWEVARLRRELDGLRSERRPWARLRRS